MTQMKYKVGDLVKWSYDPITDIVPMIIIGVEFGGYRYTYADDIDSKYGLIEHQKYEENTVKVTNDANRIWKELNE